MTLLELACVIGAEVAALVCARAIGFFCGGFRVDEANEFDDDGGEDDVGDDEPDSTDQLSPEQLRELQVYYVLRDGAAPTNPITAFSSSGGCSICLEEYEDGERCRLLPACGHLFHVNCIDPWLMTRSATCPMCRTDVVVVVRGSSG